MASEWPFAVLRAISLRYSGVGHAVVDGAVLCGGLDHWYLEAGAEFNRANDCQRCLRVLRKREREVPDGDTSLLGVEREPQ